jgi:hypothetical protein
VDGANSVYRKQPLYVRRQPREGSKAFAAWILYRDQPAGERSTYKLAEVSVAALGG